MTVREFLQNNNISLDSEIYIRIATYDTDNDIYYQDFPITDITSENNNSYLNSTDLNNYEAGWIM